jgi:peptide/nickel transport system ATP-binding protein
LNTALQDASVAVHRAETVGIVGESGSDKSTFARCMLCLIDPSAGEIHWREQAVHGLSEGRLRHLRSQVQMVFQDPTHSLNPRRTVGSSMVEGAMNFGLNKAQARRKAEELMDRIQLPLPALDRYPHQFSGGQRQRLAIACQPQVPELLRELLRDLGWGILFITHDLRVAAPLCDRVVVMNQGPRRGARPHRAGLQRAQERLHPPPAGRLSRSPPLRGFSHAISSYPVPA